MGHKIISISRQFGSGGHEIGMLVARQLGIECYDKQLIAMAAKRGELGHERLAKFDERQENPWLYEAVYDGNHRVPKGQSVSRVLFKLQSEVIRLIARQENAVIIGRCSDMILRDVPDVTLLTVFISAPMEERITRKMELEHLSQKQAEALVRKTDKQRGQYYKAYTGENWGQASRYDLPLGKSRYTIQEMAEIIILAYQGL